MLLSNNDIFFSLTTYVFHILIIIYKYLKSNHELFSLIKDHLTNNTIISSGWSEKRGSNSCLHWI